MYVYLNVYSVSCSRDLALVVNERHYVIQSTSDLKEQRAHTPPYSLIKLIEGKRPLSM